MTIEEQSHQLFSDIIDQNRLFNPITFENKTYSVGTGPIVTNPHGDRFFDLTGECGILGYGHPLTVKIGLQKLITDSQPLDSSKLREEAEDTLSDLIGSRVFITYPDKNAPFIIGGRTSSFLDKKCLKKYKKVNLIKLFRFPIALSLEKDFYQGEILDIHQTLSFLSKGQFYGKTGLIIKREEMLKEKLEPLTCVTKVSGLTVSTKHKITSPQVLIDKESSKMIFPLSFNEEILEQLISALE